MPGSPWSGGLRYTNRQGALVIAGVAMQCPAWAVLDVLPLYLYSATRGGNVRIPGAEGTRAYPKRVDEARYALPMLITGVVDRNNVTQDDIWAGLERNIAYLNTNVVNPPTAPTATRAATLTLPTGAVRTAEIQVERLELATLESISSTIRAVLEIVIPAGRFA